MFPDLEMSLDLYRSRRIPDQKLGQFVPLAPLPRGDEYAQSHAFAQYARKHEAIQGYSCGVHN